MIPYFNKKRGKDIGAINIIMLDWQRIRVWSYQLGKKNYSSLANRVKSLFLSAAPNWLIPILGARRYQKFFLRPESFVKIKKEKFSLWTLEWPFWQGTQERSIPQKQFPLWITIFLISLGFASLVENGKKKSYQICFCSSSFPFTTDAFTKLLF